jgi:methylglutamate dehydrogenase subunit B
MRIDCPLCGARDLREFSYLGDAIARERPAPDAAPADWDDYLHNRSNPAGDRQDLWLHHVGCGAWLVVTRNTTTHAIHATRLAKGDPK